MFASHALFISLFTLGQTFYYKVSKSASIKKRRGSSLRQNGTQRDSIQTISKIAKYFILISLIGAIGMTFAVLYSFAMWIDLLYYLSYIKLTISLIKYMPQAWLNFKRKSTVGWSIHNILLVSVSMRWLKGIWGE